MKQIVDVSSVGIRRTEFAGDQQLWDVRLDLKRDLRGMEDGGWRR